LTDEGLVLGLPREERYQSTTGRQTALLKQPHELGLTVIADAMRALTAQPEEQPEPLRFLSNGQLWWGDVRSFALAADRTLAIAVMIPEADLLGNIKRIRVWIGLITLMVLAVAMARAAMLARRYSRPIEALVHESERISRGDLEPGVPVVSTVTEVHRLAEAHERMREELRTLLKLEGDLQLARQIQQSTLPGQLPVLSGFEMAAWSEAAEETGGDTYDVIGYQRTPNNGALLLSSNHVDCVVLLLADATGHGIGPALSVTQVRAMFRMAVRAGEDLAALIRHMNAQLCTDLHDGRFITAWLGELNATDGTLTSFSCGQAPLLYYDAVRSTCDILPADTVPLAVFDELDVTIADPLRMRPGDVFVVLSDGIFEATDSADRQFDLERVIEVITRHHQASATQILAALREAVVVFTQGVAAADDRTAIVIKCTG
jgi:serine phosphatase RsbU (regulator of sigma subunit)